MTSNEITINQESQVSSLQQQINDDWRTAMKANQPLEKQVLAQVRSELQNWKIAKLIKEPALTDEQVQQVLSGMRKQLKDSMELSQARPEAVAQMQRELAVIQGYLPEQMTDEAVQAEIKQAIAEAGAKGIEDLGKVMKLLSPRLKGKADGKHAQVLLRNALEAGT